MSTQSIKLYLPCCNSTQEEQTKCSLITRATAIGIGSITLLIGIFILSEIPGFSTLNTTIGWSLLAGGSLTVLTGLIIRQVKKSEIDFAQITPENYEQYIDVHEKYASKTGALIFKKDAYQYDSVSPDHCYKKGDIYLSGTAIYADRSFYCGCSLEIHDGKFVHYPQLSKPPVYFSNLRDFFNYLFEGNFYQGECTRGMKFFILKTVEGKEIRYNNPYKT